MTKKNYYIHIVLLALSALMLTGLAGCIRELEDIRVESDHISFSPYMTVETKSASKINSTCGQLGIEIEDWKCDEQQTKASPTLLLEGDANVTAYLYDGTWSNDNTSWTSLTNSKFSFDGYVMTSENKVKWSSVSGNRMRVYAYAPYTSTNPTNQITGVPSLSFSPDKDVNEQVDLIAAKADISVSESKGKSIALGFNHALTGIRFKAGFACTVKSVEISGICGTGTYVIGGNWALNEDSSQSYVISFPDGKNVSSGDMITENDQTLMLIPQTLLKDAKVTLVYSTNNVEKTITASLNGRTWEPGKLIPIPLMKMPGKATTSISILRQGMYRSELHIAVKFMSMGWLRPFPAPMTAGTFTMYISLPIRKKIGSIRLHHHRQDIPTMTIIIIESTVGFQITTE